MKKIYLFISLLTLSVAVMAADNVVVRHLSCEQNIIELASPSRYLILPVQDSAPEGKIYIISGNSLVSDREINVRLARERVDYYVPLDLGAYEGKKLKLDIQGMPASSICWQYITTSDNFDASNREYWRPVYHHTPEYGWMNDPNGMFYKDGVYHLYYQHNPYGSTWGNMHWRHSSSTDLVNWKDEGIAIFPDALGTIFSGSCIVDVNNDAGFGEGAVIAFYTSAKPTPWGDVQSQSMAYSLDNGKTFIKYEDNPIVTSELRDFRDPKVFWYEPAKHWVMILAAGQQMQIHISKDLRNWEYASSFGYLQGAHGGVWECPDLVELDVEGTSEKKWVLICNINPGGPFGGSAAQYFVGTFDGKTFVNDSPTVTKWFDWGKDNYASVTWSGVADRTIALGWMSNWQYQDRLPTRQYRGFNTLPREISIYNCGGELYIKTVPVPETKSLRKEIVSKPSFAVKDTEVVITDFLKNVTGACEIEFEVRTSGMKEGMSFVLENGNSEQVKFVYDVLRGQFSMDRTKSGKVDFNENFPAVTSAPVTLCKSLKVRMFIDKTSIEIFCGDGRFVMTNLVFPENPYDTLRFCDSSDNYSIKSLNIYNY